LRLLFEVSILRGPAIQESVGDRGSTPTRAGGNGSDVTGAGATAAGVGVVVAGAGDSAGAGVAVRAGESAAVGESAAGVGGGSGASGGVSDGVLVAGSPGWAAAFVAAAERPSVPSRDVARQRVPRFMSSPSPVETVFVWANHFAAFSISLHSRGNGLHKSSLGPGRLSVSSLLRRSSCLASPTRWTRSNTWLGSCLPEVLRRQKHGQTLGPAADAGPLRPLARRTDSRSTAWVDRPSDDDAFRDLQRAGRTFKVCVWRPISP
jgi:hypothetical protein